MTTRSSLFLIHLKATLYYRAHFPEGLNSKGGPIFSWCPLQIIAQLVVQSNL